MARDKRVLIEIARVEPRLVGKICFRLRGRVARALVDPQLQATRVRVRLISRFAALGPLRCSMSHRARPLLKASSLVLNVVSADASAVRPECGADSKAEDAVVHVDEGEIVPDSEEERIRYAPLTVLAKCYTHPGQDCQRRAPCR